MLDTETIRKKLMEDADGFVAWYNDGASGSGLYDKSEGACIQLYVLERGSGVLYTVVLLPEEGGCHGWIRRENDWVMYDMGAIPGFDSESCVTQLLGILPNFIPVCGMEESTAG